MDQDPDGVMGRRVFGVSDVLDIPGHLPATLQVTLSCQQNATAAIFSRPLVKGTFAAAFLNLDTKQEKMCSSLKQVRMLQLILE